MYNTAIDLIRYTPVKIIEFSNPTHPTFFGISSDFVSGGDTNNIIMYKSYYTSGWTYATTGSALSLIGSNYAGSPIFNLFDLANANILCFLHNPIKKRFYLMTTGTGFLHIFNFQTYPGDIVSWWINSNRYNYLTYEKTIILQGNDVYWADTLSEHYSLEYDLTTGQEYAITLVRRGDTSLNGCIIKIPWREY